METLTLYSLKMVKDRTYFVRDCADSSEASRAIRALCGDSPNEKFVALLLDAGTRIIGSTLIAAGGLTGSNFQNRDVFRTAIMANAWGIILGHNHPSGQLQPSPEDIAATRRISQAGKLVGVTVVDHIIVTIDGSYSMLDKGILEFD